MEKQEKILTKVYYKKHFEDILILDNKNNIVLNSIKVYTLKENHIDIDKAVNFDICVSGNKMVLRPLEKSSEYVLLCQRVVNASVIEIDKDGNFTFYIESNKMK